MTDHLCDTNVWVALAVEEHFHHDTAQEWFDSLTGSDRAMFCRATQHSFLRLLTLESLLREYGRVALTNVEAWELYRRLLADDRVLLRVEEPPHLEAAWSELTSQRRASPGLWMDAYLAAFARTGGYRFVTADRGFTQFPGLDLVLLV